MWPISFQQGFVLVAILLLTTVEGDPIDDLLECQHHISSKYEDKCAKYNKYPNRCRTIFSTAKCLVEKACKDCSVEVGKQYAKWKGSEIRDRLSGCNSHQSDSHRMYKYCSKIKPATLPPSKSGLQTKSKSNVSSQPKSAILIGVVVAVIVLLLAGLIVWCYCCRPGPSKSTTSRAANRSKKSRKKSIKRSSRRSKRSKRSLRGRSRKSNRSSPAKSKK